MLDLDTLDLSELAVALEDHSGTEWFLDPRTGDTYPAPESSLDEGLWDEYGVDPEDLVYVEPIPSSESYGDMEDFIARVRDPGARDLLERAIAGRGAFRRFKDTLLEFPELREAWFAFHDARMERRAVEWAASQGLVEEALADAAIERRPDPDLPSLSAPADPLELASAVAEDLKALYGTRLRRVLLFGSRARGDAHPESDIDLLVVLDRVDSRWEELRRMDEVLWRHSLEGDAVVSAVVASEAELEPPERPVFATAVAEGRPLG